MNFEEIMPAVPTEIFLATTGNIQKQVEAVGRKTFIESVIHSSMRRDNPELYNYVDVQMMILPEEFISREETLLGIAEMSETLLCLTNNGFPLLRRVSRTTLNAEIHK